MTPEELQTCFDGKERRKHCEYADSAVDRAVQRSFAIFGIDVGDPEKVKKLQSVFQFAENMQKITKKSNIVFWMTFVAALAGAMALTFWEGLKAALKCLPFILLFAIPAHAADWSLTKGEKQAELAFQLLNVADLALTDRIVNQGGYEMNPLLPINDHTSDLEMVGITVVIGGLHYLATVACPVEYRPYWQWISAGFKGLAVGNGLTVVRW